MTTLSPSDKLSLVAFLESATTSLATVQAVLPLVEDDGLRKLVEAAISTNESHIKGVQEFCQSHGLV